MSILSLLVFVVKLNFALHISNVSVYSVNYTVDSSKVYLVASVIVSSSPCYVQDVTIANSYDSTFVTVCYNGGSLLTTCPSTDTFELGIRKNEWLHITAIFRQDDGPCINPFAHKDTFDFNLNLVYNTIEQIDFSSGMNLYPNPSTNLLKITSEQTIQKAELYNLLGEQVLQQNIDAKNAELNIAVLPKGIYLLKLKGSGWERVRRVVKE